MMSFDLFFQPAKFKTESAIRKNPFTGEAQAQRQVEPTSGGDVARVTNILTDVGTGGPDEFGRHIAKLSDGGVAEIHASELMNKGCMVAVRRLTPDLVSLLHRMLGAADWVLLPAMEGNPAIVSSKGGAVEFADVFPEIVCDSAEKLGALLAGGRNDLEELPGSGCGREEHKRIKKRKRTRG